MREEFEFIEPMKAKISDVDFLEHVSCNPVWAAGEKFDGYREQLHLGSTRNELYSSLGTSHVAKVPQFSRVIPELAGTVIDTEGMSPTRMRDDNASCFKAYPESAIDWQCRYGQAFLVAFDVLYYKGRGMMDEQFSSRRVVLEQILSVLWRHEFGEIRLEQLVFTGKLWYYEKIVVRTQAEGHEGVMLKRMDAPYRPGKRGPGWLKVKRQEDFVCVITGFMPGSGKYEGMIGSLIFEGDGVSGTASGMNDTERAHMTEYPEEYVGRKAVIRAQAKTQYGALTSPQYKGLVGR